MKSNKLRRAEIDAHRAMRAARSRVVDAPPWQEVPGGAAPCNPELLAPYNARRPPRFVERGYYQNIQFRCRDCGKVEIWRATQQKWWYEVAKGPPDSVANRCERCRRIEHDRKAEARRIHLEGVARRRIAQSARQPSQ